MRTSVIGTACVHFRLATGEVDPSDAGSFRAADPLFEKLTFLSHLAIFEVPAVSFAEFGEPFTCGY